MLTSRAVEIEPTRVRRAPVVCYFFLVEEGDSAVKTRYQHTAVAVGEGLADLGIRFVANIDYWPPAPGAPPLFRGDPGVDPYDCSVVIFTSDWLEERRAIPARLFEGPQRPLTVYIDTVDGTKLRSLEPGFPKFDVVLRAHFGGLTSYPANFRPWAFGLTNRIIEATAPREPVEVRERRLLVSYRHAGFPHPVRTHMEHWFMDRLGDRLRVERYREDSNAAPTDPLVEHFWHITGRRHSPRYFKALRTSLACACFGGYFIPEWPADERRLISRSMKRLMTRFRLRSKRITQFDSWRFWESFAAGCTTIHLDLEKYRAFYPVMPRNWEHYIGLNLDALETDIERMFADPQLLARVAAAGRVWGLANYGPRATAQRCLQSVGILPP